jgi:hypothetical protein
MFEDLTTRSFLSVLTRNLETIYIHAVVLRTTICDPCWLEAPRLLPAASWNETSADSPDQHSLVER